MRLSKTYKSPPCPWRGVVVVSRDSPSYKNTEKGSDQKHTIRLSPWNAHDFIKYDVINQKVCFACYYNTVLSRKYAPLRDNAPPPPPILLMKTTAQVLLSVKTLTVTNNLCDVYKILYYAAVYVCGHLCYMLS